MNLPQYTTLAFILAIASISPATASTNPESIPASALQNFSANPQPIQQLIKSALALAGQNIGYQYGSANPQAKGMDCSGTIYYLLNQMHLKDVPRSSYLFYQWVKEKGHFYPVNSHSLSSPEFSHLKPGDLLFWSGTYETGHALNVSHVMIYIGKNAEQHPLMAGASDGRSYKGRKIYGVSVFDFQLPHAGSSSRFLGYSCIPQISC